MTHSPLVVLASASAARARLLENAHVAHMCDPANVDEALIKQNWTGNAQGLAIELAQEKALSVSTRHPGAWVIGADQVLALKEEILDKSGDKKRVSAQLRKLRGQVHTLISAVAVVRDGEVIWSFADQAHLRMRDFSDAFLDDYIERVGGEVAESVGAYHLEGLGAQLFETVEGDYFTVLGLPLIPLLKVLRTQKVLRT